MIITVSDDWGFALSKVFSVFTPANDSAVLLTLVYLWRRDLLPQATRQTDCEQQVARRCQRKLTVRRGDLHFASRWANNQFQASDEA